MNRQTIRSALTALAMVGLASTAAWAQGHPKVNGEPMSSHANAGKDIPFLQAAYSINEGEIQVGELAVQRASSDAVRQLARRIVEDHTRGLEQLGKVAAEEQLTMPTQVMAEQRELKQHLSEVPAASFDREYVNAMVKGHHKAIAKFEEEMTDGKNAGLRNYARQELSVLRSHEEMAKKVQQELERERAR